MICNHIFIRESRCVWICSKCLTRVIPLIFFFTPEFFEMFKKYGWRAYYMFEGKVYRDEITQSVTIKKRSKRHKRRT